MIAKEYSALIGKEQIKCIPEPILLKFYTMMLKIRMTEEKIADLIINKEIVCPCHLYIGQEAVAVGVCSALTNDDYVFSTHRSHGHYLAKGGNLETMMAELYGKATGCSKGHGGSMHLAAPDVGFPGSSAIVGGTIPLAIGTALSSYIKNLDNVSVAFFGDGAATEGVFYESLNFAALKKLPVIFICENNFYSTHMRISDIQSDVDIYKRAKAFGMPALKIAGNNVIEVYNAAKEAIDNARAGNGPTLIECVTYRWRGHVGPNWDIDKGLRSQEELAWWQDNCAIKNLEDALLVCGLVSEAEKDTIVNLLNAEIENAILFAKESSFPDPLNLKDKVFLGN